MAPSFSAVRLTRSGITTTSDKAFDDVQQKYRKSASEALEAVVTCKGEPAVQVRGGLQATAQAVGRCDLLEGILTIHRSQGRQSIQSALDLLTRMVREYREFLDQILDSDDASTFRNDVLSDAVQREAAVAAALSDCNKLIADVQELKVRNPDLFSY
jgi:hypothetical protein